MLRSMLILIYLIGLIAGSVIRKRYTRHFSRAQRNAIIKNPIDILLTVLTGIGMFVLPLVYLLTDWFASFDYTLPVWISGIGIIGFSFAIWLLWRSHAALNHSWTPVIEPGPGTKLITHGIYRTTRHPMYSAHLVWAISQALLLQNWIAGWSFFILSIPLYIYRIPREERLLLKKFGNEYKRYIGRTGCLWPRF